MIQIDELNEDTELILTSAIFNETALSTIHEIPLRHLELIHPLGLNSARILYDSLIKINLYTDTAFKEHFSHIDSRSTLDVTPNRITKWLFKQGIPFNKQIAISWSAEYAVIAPWKVAAQYWNQLLGALPEIIIIAENSDWGTTLITPTTISSGYNNRYPLTSDT